MLAAVMFWFVLSTELLAATEVTSREQFSRLAPGGLPTAMHYNADRAWLELRADRENCPSSAKGFFELNINSKGEVTKARDVRTSRTGNLRALAANVVRNLLTQIRFRPLSLGTRAASVHTFATVVCQ